MDENNNSKTQKWFLHIDLDAFFASVEQLDNPQYRGQPVIVGGYKDDVRGVVSTASYEARKYGVHSAMPIFQAVRLCPNGIFLRGRMERYAELSYKIMNIFKEFSPDIDQMSIDEAFIDITGTEQLFGPPEETALKVKKRVKDLTGLTVSVGLASTKYLAKIASGFSKPDGFYFIHPGDEQNFMLSLPLKKVWGVGPKALERLKKAGINSTKDIYNTPLDLLEFLFGTSMANFLYSVVRGEEKESFTRKPKSHSISNEKTFLYDITDVYTAETELLELAHCVMFRLLKEEMFSRTVTVKIKYDDFTSVTIQKTVDRNIITIDSFFEIIKELFEEKYQQGRGIRLLGVGFEKVSKNDNPQQQSLFENKDDKKQAIEKAILDLSKKHPEIKIKKARLLKSIALFFYFFLELLTPFSNKNQVYANENTVSIKGAGTLIPESNKSPTLPIIPEKEENGAIFNWEINDSNNVDFNISGSWKGELTGNFLSTFGNNTPFSFQTTIPVFKQDIELSTLLTLNNKWYFEGNFADNFDNNTLTFGYNGNNYFKSAKLSNRNITMPDIYSAEQFGYGLSGGNNQAPGFSAHWQAPSDKWAADILLRYDMTTPKTVSYYGMNRLSNRSINIENYIRGNSFTFPIESKELISQIKNIYVENKNGTYADSRGTLYKKLSLSDYFYSKENNILYLSQNAKGNSQNGKIPTILVTFLDQTSAEKIKECAGNYNDETSFLGKIQKLFNTKGKKYNLSDFDYDLLNEIENSNALVIQNSFGFSPFIIAGIYDCGTTNNNDVKVISGTTGENVNNYSANIIDQSFISPNEDFINLTHTYASVKNTNNGNAQFPFADISPEIYLNLKSQSDLSLLLQDFSAVSNINIGTKASAGSIQIYKNGRYYTDFIYDNKSGNIILGDQISPTDVLKINYQDEASDYSNGNISFGLGYFLNIIPELQWDISFTGQHPIIFKDFVPSLDNLQNSFFALTTGINYKNDNLFITDKISGYIKKSNPFDILLISKQNDSITKTYDFNYYSGLKTISVPKIKSINLLSENNKTINNHYGEQDNILKTYSIPLEWNFVENKNYSTPFWAAVDVKLDSGDLLKNSSQLKLKLKLNEKLQPDSTDLYIQLGLTAGKDKENKSTRTFNIKSTDFDYNSTEWQDITITLNDIDRSFLISDYDCRLVVIQNNGHSSKGKLSIGPYTPITKSIFTSADNNINITTSSVSSGKDSSSSEISWNFSKDDIINNKEITASSYFSPADFSSYNLINFKFAYTKRNVIENNDSIQSALNNEPELTLILDSGSLSLNTQGKEALKIIINDITPYINDIRTYHTLTVNLKNKILYIDGKEINKEKYSIIVCNKNIVPSRFVYKINPFTSQGTITSGSFYVDNITYEENELSYGFENYIAADYKKDKILEINNYSILDKGFISASSTQKIERNNVTVLSSFDGGITVAGIAIHSDLSMNQNNVTNAGHSLSLSKPIFNIFSVSEDYRWDKKKSVKKDNNFTIDLSKIKLPLTLTAAFNAEHNNYYKTQNQTATLSSKIQINKIALNINSSVNNSERVNLLNNNLTLNDNKYFSDWYEITKYEFSMGSKKAYMRNSFFNNSIGLNIYDNFISPALFYNLSCTYENSEKTSFIDKSNLAIYIPVNFKNNFISLRLSKTGENSSSLDEDGNYFSDMEKMFINQKKNKYFYSSIPFYDLFDKNIKNKLTGSYSTKYELNYKKKLFNSFKDLFIPSSASFTVMRDASMKNKFSDIYQIKTTITNTSINNFGRTSMKQIFNWFQQEEIISSISAVLRIPTDELKNLTYDISSYLQIMFIINNNSLLNTALDFTISTGNNWNTKGTFVYSRNGKSTLIIELIKLISDKAKEIDFKIMRKDSFNYEIGASDSVIRQQYDYSHSIDINFLKNFTVSTGLGLSFSHIQDKASAISLNYTLGGKISF